MMRVLVTGSSGLIGRWVGGRLNAENVHWAGVDIKEDSDDLENDAHYCVDILDKEALESVFREYQPTHIIHLAARCDLDGRTLEDYEVNCGGVKNICDVIREGGSVRRAIFTSSQLVCEVGYVPKSDTDYCPHTVYGESKVQTEKTVRDEAGGGVEWCLARPTTVWGPYISEHYQTLLKHICNGTYFHSGSGPLYKSYSYAENIAYQYYKLLLAPAEAIHQQVFYMADYEPLSLRDYANRLAQSLGAKRPITVPLPIARLMALVGDYLNLCRVQFPYNSFRLKNIRTEYIFDMEKTKAVCGPLPKTFGEGVVETASWYESSRPARR